MGNLNYPYIPSMEWEGLQDKYEIINEGYIRISSLPEGCKKLEIFRDDNYNIKGLMTGYCEKDF